MISFDSQWLKRVIFVVVIVISLRAIKHYVDRWTHAPPPTTQTLQIAAGSDARILIGMKEEPGNTWRKSRYWSPYYLDYSSSAGEVEICIVPCSTRAKGRVELERMTRQFASGQVPAESISLVSGVNGRIYVKDPKHKSGSANLSSYAVFVRSANDSEVNFIIHYWR